MIMEVHCPLFHLITDKSILNFNFWTDKILKTLSANLIKIKLMVMIWSVFLCLKYVTNPLVNLFIIFFKKPNVPIHTQKKDKQCAKNYRPFSILPNCSCTKHFICTSMLPYFSENNLIFRGVSWHIKIFQ